MWAKFMETKNGYTAQIWKDLFNNCAVSVRVVPKGGTGIPWTWSRAISTCRGGSCTWRKR